MDIKKMQQVYEEYMKRRVMPKEKEIPPLAVIKPNKK